MASGIEVAGLILGVLPLFISALEHYNDSLDPIKAFWDFDSQLPVQIRKLRNQHVHYEQTLRLLLSPITDPDEVSAMIDHPNGDLWSGEEMQVRLEDRLQESYHAYHETITHMEGIMKRLAKDLKIDDSERANRMNLQVLLKRAPRKDNRFEFRRRVKFGMSKKRLKMLLNDLDECNKELERFTDKSERLEPYRTSSKSVFSPPLNQIRSYLHDLYRMLCAGESCQSPHRVKLLLEKRIRGSIKAKHRPRMQLEDQVDTVPCFRVSLYATAFSESQDGYFWICKDAQVQILDKDDVPGEERQWNGAVPSSDRHRAPDFQLSRSTSSITIMQPSPNKFPTSLRRTVEWASDVKLGCEISVDDSIRASSFKELREVADICTVIRQDGRRSPSCLGFYLHPSEGKLRGPYSIPGFGLPQNRTMVTLGEILEAPTVNQSRKKLSRKERMMLAVTLSSSYLQLQASPWLPESWGKEDIVFDAAEPATLSPLIDVERPHILRELSLKLSVGDAGIETPPGPLPSSHHGNSSLLALGILLLELHTGEAFEEFQNREIRRGAGQIGLDDVCSDDNMSRLLKLSQASQWVNHIQDDLSEAYLRAIRHCIRSYFDETSGKEAIFHQAILEQVVLPLQDELRTFMGGSR